jgi:hypothetical protein
VDELGRSFVEREGYGYDVEAKSRSLRLFFIDEHASGAKNACALASVDRFERMPALHSCSRPYLDEYAEARLADDEINLALGPTPVAYENLVAKPFEMVSGELLRSLAKR